MCLPTQAGSHASGDVHRALLYAQQLKAEGNAMFLQGRYAEASAKYKFARFNVSGTLGKPEQPSSESNGVSCPALTLEMSSTLSPAWSLNSESSFIQIFEIRKLACFLCHGTGHTI